MTSAHMPRSRVAPGLWPSPLLSRIPFRSAIARRAMRLLLGLVPPPKLPGVRLEAADGLPSGSRLHLPALRTSRGALLWIHGGGFLIGHPAQDDLFCASTALAVGVPVMAVGYRLAPEHPFPAALDDCLAGWAWLQNSAGRLGIDPAKIAVGGQSAGGALAASLVQRIHDLGGAKAAAQWLFCPMLDDRTATHRELDDAGHLLWNNRQNEFGWRSYLGAPPGAANLPRYAAAARRDDLDGLPPAWIGVGDLDLFCAEDSVYAERLRAKNIEVTFETVPGAPHGFTAWAPKAAITKSHVAGAREWLRLAFAR